MSEEMRTLSFRRLLDWTQTELRATGSIFSIPKEQFCLPQEEPAFSSEIYGSRLTTPIGPAAGPHTQLSQNILSAWLTGGRFIELKTVQVMDELEIPRPCIDLEDEGYNVEWSQELRLTDSVREYAHAWAMIHVLRRILGLEDRLPFGTVFNMSVGYNLEGILSEPMQMFMATLENAAPLLDPIRRELEHIPELRGIEIPDRIVNSVTLSTMHGCPPEEIEKIARYLIEERGLHTTVKLNPTLLGKETVLGILHDDLGFTQIEIPDRVFEHDLGYRRALELVASLKSTAAQRGLVFAVKLSNTLAMANHRGVLPGDEMYMSGRALFPLTVELFRRMHDAFDGELNVSYSAGADALNISQLLAAGARPITVASDLLKPGGYAKFGQFIEEIGSSMAALGATSLDDLASGRAHALQEMAEAARIDSRYAKAYALHGLPKTATPLEPFDCIEAPCIAPCAVHQDVPDYIRALANEDPDRALAIILSRNPLPGSTGHVCTSLCQTRCTRNNNDEPVAIRKLKRFAVAHGSVQLDPAAATKHRVAIIGGGPSGLAASYFLALSGIRATVFEARERAGGMLAIAPTFRLPTSVVEEDINRIRSLGVEVRTSSPVSSTPDALLAEGYDAVYIACGYVHDAPPKVEGMETDGVFGALDVLLAVSRGERPQLGDHVVVIGGGNTAMDAARTSQRLLGAPVTVAYRRTQAEMPAELEEIEDLLAEGNRLVELASPVRILSKGGHVSGIECVRNELGEPDADGRRRPQPIEGSTFALDATAIIFATGQRSDLGFLGESDLTVRPNGGIVVQESTGRASERPIYAGGDVARGPETIIAACADGRRAAEAICEQLDVHFRTVPWAAPDAVDPIPSKVARARKVRVTPSRQLPVLERAGFDLVEQTYDATEAAAEAARCLDCSSLCDKCVEVCPNRANVPIEITTGSYTLPVYTYEDGLRELGKEDVSFGQSRQILHIEDFCNACGNCSTFCVHPGDPFKMKPRIYLNAEDFGLDEDLAFLLDGASLRRKSKAIGKTKGVESVLEPTPDGFAYTTPSLRAAFDREGTWVETVAVAPFDGRESLRPAIEMIKILEGIQGSAPQIAGMKMEGGD